MAVVEGIGGGSAPDSIRPAPFEHPGRQWSFSALPQPDNVPRGASGHVDCTKGQDDPVPHQGNCIRIVLDESVCCNAAPMHFIDLMDFCQYWQFPHEEKIVTNCADFRAPPRHQRNSGRYALWRFRNNSIQTPETLGKPPQRMRATRRRSSSSRACNRPQSKNGPGSVLRPGAMSLCPATSSIG
jgi:hypothetical protein